MSARKVAYSAPVIEGNRIVIRDPLGDFAVGTSMDARLLARQLVAAAKRLESTRRPRKAKP